MKLSFIFLALALAADALAQAKAPQCSFVRIAEWTVRANQQRPVLDGEINGRKVGILLDTGAPHGVIARSATSRLGLIRQRIEGYRSYALAAETHAEVVEIDELRIGASKRRNLKVMVAREADLGDDFTLILGEDFLHKADIEFDLRNNAVRVYQPKGCAGFPLAYWSRQALEVPLYTGDRIAFPVSVNGQQLRAVLDSGAEYSVLARAEAERRGVYRASAGADPAGCVRRIGAKPVESWSAPFDGFAISNELVRSPRIRVADLWLHTTYSEAGEREPAGIARGPQMLLGADFLRSHRVLVSRSQQRMYFTYEGGTVFPEVAGKPCNAS